MACAHIATTGWNSCATAHNHKEPPTKFRTLQKGEANSKKKHKQKKRKKSDAGP